jgi:pyruvate,water dikinase
MGLRDFIKRITGNEPQAEPENVEHLRVTFKERYHSFKLLLNANNRALEIMAILEKALYDAHPFGMSFIRSNVTAISVNVFRMIKNLDDLAPEKYKGLFSRFDEIQKNIDLFLKTRKVQEDQRLVVDLSRIHSDLADSVGNKMAHLGQVKNTLNLKVPDGFAITARAYHRFMEANDIQTEINRRLQSAETEDIQELHTLSAEIQQMIIRAAIPEDLGAEILSAFSAIEKKAGKSVHLAVRSSALGEDAGESAFAGQYRTELNVSGEHLFDAYKEVLASKYSLQAMTYRLNKGIKDEDVPMSVGCLVMVDALSGGVIYTRNPVDKTDDSIFINAAWGLPKSVVDGSVDCDTFVVSRTPELRLAHQDIKEKKIRFSCYPDEGVCREEISDESIGKSPSLTGQQVLMLAEQALGMESHYGMPQDIEWAVTEKGDIVILQCRPLFQISGLQGGAESNPDSKEDARVILSGGITASPGIERGPVFKVDRGEDIFQFPRDAILVVRQALPRWASLLSRASGVISEQGGFAGHLANVAREFGIPALFGMEGAMEKLNNGDFITLDAGRGSIYQGSITPEPMPSKAGSRMKGTPVYETLAQISRLVVPLNLLDPESRDFTPSSCKTFHDITRFVHEKSVSEMFSFGKEHNFSERSSKQLYYKAPMLWWILNLDDGFKEEVAGKYVKLENIISIPMLAFWEGFAAIPWDGPPAIDGKGLVSVMFQATTNPALTTGLRSKYSERNYFMISKHYLSLNSRLGFHFSILEALVGDRPSENYINFQFKGGAADSDRRLKRVIFIGDLIENYGFRVDRKGDALISRMENQDKQYMIDRLKILGYLTLHTRQLDMIMGSPERVAYHRKKMMKDIDQIIQ